MLTLPANKSRLTRKTYDLRFDKFSSGSISYDTSSVMDKLFTTGTEHTRSFVTMIVYRLASACQWQWAARSVWMLVIFKLNVGTAA